MGRYYYVRMVNALNYNDDNGRYLKTETAKEIENIAGSATLGYSEPNGLAIFVVKYRKMTRKKKGFLGVEYNESYNADVPVFVICEDKNNYLEEVITGKKYAKEKDYTYYQRTCPRLTLSIIKEVPSSRVAEILKSMTENEVNNYVKKINALDRAIYIGYQKDIQRTQLNQAQKQRDDSYIKSFRKRYGK